MARRTRRRRDTTGEAPTVDDTKAALLKALALDELAVRYQPIVRTEDGRVVGLEALVRWRRAGGRLLRARDFLESARRVGLLFQVDHRVIELVARDLVRARLSTALEWISVNVAPGSLRHRGVLDRLFGLAEELRRFGLELVVELSERSPDFLGDGVDAEVAGLRGTGARVAVDDFGAEPSLSDRLLHLPGDMVKIDVRTTGTNGDPSRPGSFVRELVGACRSVGRSVAVKCVEGTGPALDAVAPEADFVQGRLFGSPDRI